MQNKNGFENRKKSRGMCRGTLKRMSPLFSTLILPKRKRREGFIAREQTERDDTSILR